MNCELSNCYFGPATLDLRGVVFSGSKLKDVTFMLGKLRHADFTNAVLDNVVLRKSDLTGASFRAATLKRVCFERASLQGADFSDCTLVDGDFWGEPPWDGATVPDHVRYSFAVISEPIRRIDVLLRSPELSAIQREHLLRLHEWLMGWAADRPEVLIAHRELSTVFDFPTFAWLLKQLKGTP